MTFRYLERECSLRLAIMPDDAGNCLVLSYGVGDERRHVVITQGGWRSLRSLIRYLQAESVKQIELLVISGNNDDDPIGLGLWLRDLGLSLDIKDIWFNGYQHLIDAVQEADAIAELEGLQFNKASNGKLLGLDGCGNPLEMPPLEGQLHITVLSPAHRGEASTIWRRVFGTSPPEGLTVDTEALPSVTPTSSVSESISESALAQEGRDRARQISPGLALLIEYDGRSIVLDEFVHPDLIARSLKHVGADNPVALDLLQMPAHYMTFPSLKNLFGSLVCNTLLMPSTSTSSQMEVVLAAHRGTWQRQSLTILNYPNERTPDGSIDLVGTYFIEILGDKPLLYDL